MPTPFFVSAKCGILKIVFCARKEVDRYEQNPQAAAGAVHAAVLCTVQLPDRAAGQRKGTGRGTAACPETFRRLRCAANCPERLAGGERPAEISHSGRAAFSLCAAGLGRRWSAGRGGAVYHRPDRQRLRSHFAARRCRKLAGAPERGRPCRNGGERQPCPIAGYRQLPAGCGLYRRPE